MADKLEIEIPDALKKIIDEGHCCICGGPLKGSYANLVTVLKKAPWSFPIWSNIFTPEMGNRAMAIVCDNCVNEETGISLANPTEVIEIQVNDDYIFIYHDINTLEDAEPITEGMVESGQQRIQDEADDYEINDAIMEMLPVEISNVDVNLESLKHSDLYLIVISKTYLDAIEDPNHPQHIDLISQLILARSTQKKTLILYDSRVEDRIEFFKEFYLHNINIISIDSFNALSPEDRRKTFDAALRKLQEAVA